MSAGVGGDKPITLLPFPRVSKEASTGPHLGVLIVAGLSVGFVRGGGVAVGGHLLPAVGSLLHVVVVIATVARHLVGQAIGGWHQICAKRKPSTYKSDVGLACRTEINEAVWISGDRQYQGLLRVCVLFLCHAFT